MNNSITVLGHVGQEPKASEFESGNKVVRFSIAVKEYAGKDKEPETLWLDVESWNGQSEQVIAHVTKGREVLVQGRLAINSYISKEGVKVTKPIIKLSSFHLCGKKPQ